MSDAVVKVPIINVPEVGGCRFPMDLESWHKSGNRISFSIGDASFEQFRASDTEALYEIRNDATVRPFMPSSEPLAFSRHREWVDANLLAKTKTSPLLIIGRSAAGDPMGFGLLKPTAEAGTLEVGVIVAGRWQGGSLPTRLGGAMFAIAGQVLGATTLVSYVNEAHEHALRLNRGAGLMRADASDKPGEVFFRTPMESLMSTRIYKRCVRGLVVHVRTATCPVQG